jgi:hypothetical protein
MSYRTDRQWADAYAEQVKAILTAQAARFVRFEFAPDEADRNRATDFVVRVEGGDVAVRVRSTRRDFRDVTIRTRRANGVRTELDKLRAGFARWYLCCWSDQAGLIGDWVLLDMDLVRARGLLDRHRREHTGDGGRTFFVGIPVDELRRAGCVVTDNCRSPCTKPIPQRRPG